MLQRWAPQTCFIFRHNTVSAIKRLIWIEHNVEERSIMPKRNVVHLLKTEDSRLIYGKKNQNFNYGFKNSVCSANQYAANLFFKSTKYINIFLTNTHSVTISSCWDLAFYIVSLPFHFTWNKRSNYSCRTVWKSTLKSRLVCRSQELPTNDYTSFFLWFYVSDSTPLSKILKDTHLIQIWKFTASLNLKPNHTKPFIILAVLHRSV